MLAFLCPKVIVNIAIPVLMDASTLAQCLGMLNTFLAYHPSCLGNCHNHCLVGTTTKNTLWYVQMPFGL